MFRRLGHNERPAFRAAGYRDPRGVAGNLPLLGMEEGGGHESESNQYEDAHHDSVPGQRRMLERDVVIVGAGPVGLTAAIDLDARRFARNAGE